MPDEATIEQEALELSRPERRAEIARLIEAGSPRALEAIVDEVKHVRDEYAFRLARGLMRQLDPVDQREIDYKRGFWQGALWATVVLPKQATDALTKLRDDEETEEANS
jgi:hypothetical protein